MSDLAHDANHALGRLPSGVYILTATDPTGQHRTGMLASWVQQAGFSPPMITVAIGTDRFIRTWIQATGRFTLSQIPAAHKSLVKHFGRGFAPEEDAFVGINLLSDTPTDAPPVIAEALAYLIVEPRGEIASGDHTILLGEVVGGALLSEEEPMLHVRKIGSHY